MSKEKFIYFYKSPLMRLPRGCGYYFGGTFLNNSHVKTKQTICKNYD